MADSGKADGGSGFSFRFIGGRYRGGAFPLPAAGTLVTGRAAGVAMVLAEDMVSRRHAVVSIENGVVRITDLGSTNGIFVNGDQVKSAELVAGDRVLIGACVVKLVRDGREGAADTDEMGGPGALSGRVQDVGLPAVLQLCAAGGKSGDLRVRAPGRRHVTIHLRDGRIGGVSLDGVPGADPYKAFYLALTWDEGHFDLGPPGDLVLGEPLPESVEALLLEGLRQRDELVAASAGLPRREAGLALHAPLVPPLRALTPELLDSL